MIFRSTATRLCAIVLASMFTLGANATTLTFTESYFEGGTDVFGPFDTGFLAGFGAALDALPQFDPSLGTLNSVSLTFEGEIFVDGFLMAEGQTDPGEFSDAIGEYVGGVGLAVPLGGTLSLLSPDLFSNSLGCSADIDEGGCEDFDSIFEFASGGVVLTGSDMDAFLGVGTLDDMRLELLAGLDSEISLDNFDDAFLEVTVEFVGDVTVEYDFAPVPLPAAVWLFGSALVGLGLTRRRSA